MSDEQRITCEDFGIDPNNPTFCVKCKTEGLVLASDRASWFCTHCHWTWSVAKERGDRMIFNAQEIAPELMSWYDKGVPTGESMGWPELDPYLKIRRGEWTAVTGWSSHGKSQFMDAVMINMARMHGWRWALFSPENVPYSQHVRGLIQKATGKRFASRGESAPGTVMDRDELLLAWAWLKEHIYFVDAVEPTFETVLKQFWNLVKTKDVQAVVIDPWNELEHDRPHGMNETEYTAKVLIRFRDFCKAAHVHGFIVAHPSKMALVGPGTKREKDDTKRPVVRLMDISGSAHFENKPFNGISVWRNPSAEDSAERNQNHIFILKQRTEGVGRVGQVTLTWDPLSTAYADGRQFLTPDTFVIEELKRQADRRGAAAGRTWRDFAQRLEADWFLRLRPLDWQRVSKTESHFEDEFCVAVGSCEARAWRAELHPGRLVWWASFERKDLGFSDMTQAADREAAFGWAERWMMSAAAEG